MEIVIIFREFLFIANDVACCLKKVFCQLSVEWMWCISTERMQWTCARNILHVRDNECASDDRRVAGK